MVSVIITTFNRAKYIGSAIDSVLSQTYQDTEIIVLDDCSKDSTPQILSGYRNKDKRINIFRNTTNVGVAKNLNKGVGLAKGEFIAILDDDDYWSDKSKMQKQVDFLRSHPECVLVGGGAIVKDQSDKEMFRYLLPTEDDDIKKYLLVDNCFVHSAVLFRKKYFAKAGGYNEHLNVDWDWDLWLRLGKLGKLGNLPEYVVNYLQWDQNISNASAIKNLQTRMYLIKNYKKDYPGSVKSLMLGLTTYLYSFLPFKKRLVFLKGMKKTFFGQPFYEK